MEGVLGIIFSAENVRMLVLLAFGFCGYVMIKGQMRDLEVSLEKKIDTKMDEKLAAFHAQLKANDFAHLNNTIEALTFTLEKNGFLKREDKEYIDGRLDK
jgi:hypothetical protein